MLSGGAQPLPNIGTSVKLWNLPPTLVAVMAPSASMLNSGRLNCHRLAAPVARNSVMRSSNVVRPSPTHGMPFAVNDTGTRPPAATIRLV